MTTNTATKIKYTTKRGEYAREYIAEVGDLRINLDKTAPEYLGWCIFIIRFNGTTSVDSTETHTVKHTYAQTLAEAKQIAQLFVDSDVILKRAV